MLAAVSGCAGDEEPAAIDGQVDFEPADDAKTMAEDLRTQTGQTQDAPKPDTAKGKDPTSDEPQLSKQECALAVQASNDLIAQHVIALFPAKALRHVEPLRPADTDHCDPKEGPDFGGVSALWKNITGAEAIEILEKDGWTRTDPAEGEPAWAKQGLKHGNGDLNLEPAEKFIVTFNATRGGQAMWIELTQDGLRAGLG